MKNEYIKEAMEICMKHRSTIEFLPVVNGYVKRDYLGMVYGCPAVITKLVEKGFMLSMEDNHIIIDKL